MQHFFFLCTMLIVGSQAFQEGFRGSQISASVKTKISGLSPEHLNVLNFEDEPFARGITPHEVRNSLSVCAPRKISDVDSSKHILCRKKKMNKRKWRRRKSRTFPSSHLFDSNNRRFRGLTFRPVPVRRNSPFVKLAKFFQCVHHPEGTTKVVGSKNYPYVVCALPQGDKKSRRVDGKRRTKLVGSKRKKNKRSAQMPEDKYPDPLMFNYDNYAFYTTRQPDMGEFNSSFLLNTISARPLESNYFIEDANNNNNNNNNNFNFEPSPTEITFPYNNVPVSPSPLPLPQVNFKFPYDPGFYEANFKNYHVDKKIDSILASAEHTEPPKPIETKSTSDDILKVKQILEDVKQLLKEEKDPQGSNRVMKTSLKFDDETNGTVYTNDFIKAKIDNVAIPLLTQISEELKVKEVSDKCKEEKESYDKCKEEREKTRQKEINEKCRQEKMEDKEKEEKKENEEKEETQKEDKKEEKKEKAKEEKKEKGKEEKKEKGKEKKEKEKEEKKEKEKEKEEKKEKEKENETEKKEEKEKAKESEEKHEKCVEKEKEPKEHKEKEPKEHKEKEPKEHKEKEHKEKEKPTLERDRCRERVTCKPPREKEPKEHKEKEPKEHKEKEPKEHKEKEPKEHKEKEPKEKIEKKAKHREENQPVRRRGTGCNLEGPWMSSMMGMEVNLTTLPNLMLKVKILASNKEELINKKWSVLGLVLSKRGGPFILAGIFPQRRRVASFLGQCRTVEEEETIFGSWTFASCAPRWVDLWSAVQTRLDVWKRIKKAQKSV